MVIESEETVYYLNPCDSAKMSAARGDFTVPEDAHKVNSILDKMLDAKVSFFYEQGDATLARQLQCFKPNFIAESGSRASKDKKDAEPSSSVSGEEAVEALKARFQWRDEETEAAWMKATGWTLLMLAAAADDLPAVKHLLAQPDATPEHVESRVGMFAKNTPLREQPFSVYIGSTFDELTAMVAASTWASPPVLEALLEAGGVPDMNVACGFHPCHCTGAVMGGKEQNLKFLLGKDPELATKRNDKAVFGFRALHYASEYSGPEPQKIFKALLDAGAAETVNTPDDFGNYPVHFVSSFSARRVFVAFRTNVTECT